MRKFDRRRFLLGASQLGLAAGLPPKLAGGASVGEKDIPAIVEYLNKVRGSGS